jgi:hypothetical protein
VKAHDDRLQLVVVRRRHLKWAVTAHVTGLNLQNIGVSLMVGGVIALAIGLYLLFRPRWPAGARPGSN